MLKLVIVDDEPMEREAIASYIDWGSMGIEVVGNAGNGKQAIDVIMDLQPDIVISDVKMPVMDGLEMAQKVKAIFPGIKIIFCSAYDEFEYVKNAINAEAYGYILKPVKDDELFRVVKSAADKCIKEKYENSKYDVLKKQVEKNLSLLKERVIKDIIFNRDVDENSIKLSHSLLRGFSGIMVVIAVQINKGCEYKAAEIEKILASEVKDYENSLIAQLKEDEYVIIICMDTACPEEVHGIVKERAAVIRENVLKRLNVDIIQGYSSCEGGIDALPALYREAKRAAYYNMLIGMDIIIGKKDIETIGSTNECKDSRIDDGFYMAIRNEDIELANSFLDAYFDDLLRTGQMSLQYIHAGCIRIINEIINILKDMGYEIDSMYSSGNFPWEELLSLERVPDVKAWMQKTLFTVIGFLDNGKKDKKSKIVYEVQDFLEENYSAPLSLDIIAEEVKLTPNYLSRIFREKTGTSLVDYLKDLRIKKAIDLLSDISVYIYEIARRVGFEDTSYFCTVFKKTVGLTPSQYREIINTNVHKK